MRQKTTKEAADNLMIADFAGDCHKGRASGSHFFKKVRAGAKGGESRSVSAAEPVQGGFTGKLLKQKLPFPPPKDPKFTFIDRIYGQTQGDKSRLEELPDAGV